MRQPGSGIPRRRDLERFLRPNKEVRGLIHPWLQTAPTKPTLPDVFGLTH
jgi:hypothetical protein